MKRFGFVAAVLVAGVLSVGPVVHAAPVLRPAGLSVGDQYQLAFVTSTVIDAQSATKVTFDTFVQRVADSAGIGIGGDLGDVMWAAVNSTFTAPAVSVNAFAARSVFNLSGGFVATPATGPGGFYSASHLAPINVTEFGAVLNTVVWTGFDCSTGTCAAGNLLGGGASASIGHSGSASAGWASVGTDSVLELHSVYALSEVLTVPGPPAILMLCMALAWLATRHIRTRRQPRSGETNGPMRNTRAPSSS